MLFKNNKNLIKINKDICKCNFCSRLVAFRERIAKEKRKMYEKEKYWGKGVPGYGDSAAKLLIIGLAPAAHGGNRTGRVFTGDKSSEFLFDCLNEVGISNQDHSKQKNDNLRLINSYLTLAVKCVPPEDKPTSTELNMCFKYLEKEFEVLVNINTILALGKVAFDAVLKYYKLKFSVNNKIKFSHGLFHSLPDGKILIGCYHPSPRNVNTGRINKEKFVILLKKTLKSLNINSEIKNN
tara:strand:- start:14 stop:727 length:714 start_codon:yes stop_codon:yes gene_type:complete